MVVVVLFVQAWPATADGLGHMAEPGDDQAVFERILGLDT